MSEETLRVALAEGQDDSPLWERLPRARTTAGSNWLPAQRVSSIRAASTGRGFLYDRAAVITSRASATATMRMPADDKDVIALLRDHNAKLKIANPEPAPLLRILISLLPWVVIIGLWLWLSRRAQSMMSRAGRSVGS